MGFLLSYWISSFDQLTQQLPLHLILKECGLNKNPSPESLSNDTCASAIPALWQSCHTPALQFLKDYLDNKLCWAQTLEAQCKLIHQTGNCHRRKRVTCSCLLPYEGPPLAETLPRKQSCPKLLQMSAAGHVSQRLQVAGVGNLLWLNGSVIGKGKWKGMRKKVVRKADSCLKDLRKTTWSYQEKFDSRF